MVPSSFMKHIPFRSDISDTDRVSAVLCVNYMHAYDILRAQTATSFYGNWKKLLFLLLKRKQLSNNSFWVVDR